MPITMSRSENTTIFRGRPHNPPAGPFGTISASAGRFGVISTLTVSSSLTAITSREKRRPPDLKREPSPEWAGKGHFVRQNLRRLASEPGRFGDPTPDQPCLKDFSRNRTEASPTAESRIGAGKLSKLAAVYDTINPAA